MAQKRQVCIAMCDTRASRGSSYDVQQRNAAPRQGGLFQIPPQASKQASKQKILDKLDGRLISVAHVGGRVVQLTTGIVQVGLLGRWMLARLGSIAFFMEARFQPTRKKCEANKLANSPPC
jgi:hypothetical protein